MVIHNTIFSYQLIEIATKAKLFIHTSADIYIYINPTTNINTSFSLSIDEKILVFFFLQGFPSSVWGNYSG
jgi:uncharacterized protein YpmS